MKSLKFKYAYLIFVTFFTVANAMTPGDNSCTMIPNTGFSFREGNGKEHNVPTSFTEQYPTTQTTPGNLDSMGTPISIELAAQTSVEKITIPSTTTEMKRFARGKKTVIILGQGFPDSQEVWKRKAAQLDAYDIVTFNYTWFSGSTAIHPVNCLLNDRYQDVINVVNYLRTQYNYEQIIGLGICYSAFTFTAAQAHAAIQGFRLFDKLILDSTFDSLLTQNLSTSADPSLSCNNDTGCLPDWLKSILITLRADRFLKWITPIVSIVPYLKQITETTPILFIHGSKDLLVPLEAFNAAWESTRKSNCMALITPYSHVSHMRKNWPLYKAVCDCFIGADNGMKNKALSDLFLNPNQSTSTTH